MQFMKSTLKKKLAVLLCLSVTIVILAGLSPVAVSAVGPSEPSSTATWDFTSVDSDGSGVGWSWVQSTKTLTLTNFSFATNADVALALPTEATIVLNGSNTIDSLCDNSSSFGIFCNKGVLSISGTGSLSVTGCASLGNDSYGIVAGSLTINGSASVTAAGRDANNNFGIYTSTLIINDNGTVAAISGEAIDYSYGIYTSALAVNDNATVTATGGGASNSYGVVAEFLAASDNAKITGTGGEAENSHGIYAIFAIFVSDNATVTAYGANATSSSCGLYVGTLIVSDSAIVTGNGGDATAGKSHGIDVSYLDIYDNATVIGNGGDALYSYGFYLDFDDTIAIGGGSFLAIGQTSALSRDYTVPDGYKYLVNPVAPTHPGGSSSTSNGSFVINNTYKFAYVEPIFTATVSSTGTNPSGGGSYAPGASVPINAGTPPVGMQFKEWTSSSPVTFANKNSASTTFTMPASNVTLTAVFEELLYSVTYNLNGGSGIVPTESTKASGATFNAASASSLTAPIGKQFKAWNTSANGTGVAYNAGAIVTMSSSNITLYAIWEDIPTYSVAVTSLWTASSGSGSYASGVVVSIHAGTSPTGMQFKEWASSSAITFADKNNASTTFTMPASDVTVTAVFEKIPADTMVPPIDGDGHNGWVWVAVTMLVCAMAIGVTWYFTRRKKN